MACCVAHAAVSFTYPPPLEPFLNSLSNNDMVFYGQLTERKSFARLKMESAATIHSDSFFAIVDLYTAQLYIGPTTYLELEASLRR